MRWRAMSSVILSLQFALGVQMVIVRDYNQRKQKLNCVHCVLDWVFAGSKGVALTKHQSLLTIYPKDFPKGWDVQDNASFLTLKPVKIKIRPNGKISFPLKCFADCFNSSWQQSMHSKEFRLNQDNQDLGKVVCKAQLLASRYSGEKAKVWRT